MIPFFGMGGVHIIISSSLRLSAYTVSGEAGTALRDTTNS